jgi:hypothetical protein
VAWEFIKFLENDKIILEIIKLELELQSKEVRRDSSRLTDLLDDEFVEIGSKADLYYKKDILERLPSSKFAEMKSDKFTGQLIKKGVILLRYDLEVLQGNESSLKSKRSSIWRFRSNSWQILFHQSTLVP